MDTQYHGNKRQNNDLQNITKKTKDPATRIPLINGGELRKGKQFLFHMWQPHCYSRHKPGGCFTVATMTCRISVSQMTTDMLGFSKLQIIPFLSHALSSHM